MKLNQEEMSAVLSLVALFFSVTSVMNVLCTSILLLHWRRVTWLREYISPYH